jgi:hypothetical protein
MTIFFAISVVGLLALVGLVADGGAKVRAIQRADTLAAEAARAGGQAVDLPAVIAGRPPTVDPERARSAAAAYLAANGASGTVAISDAGRRVSVEVTTSSPTILLGLIGINSFTVHGHSSANLVRGVTGAIP